MKHTSMSTPKLKISNLTNLQDARYCAAVGFDLVSFSLERGNVRKLPAPTVWNIATWLDGPGLALEMNIDSLDELEGASVDPAYLTFPVEDWDENLFNYAPGIILRADPGCPPEQVRDMVQGAAGKDLKFEISISSLQEYLPYQPVREHLFLHFPSMEMAAAFMRKGGKPSVWNQFFMKRPRRSPTCLIMSS